jgi:hypothetical protein
MDNHLMEFGQLRAVANCFRRYHGSEAFILALGHARNLTAGGDLVSAAVWKQIAEEISHTETHQALELCLKRAA